MATLTVKEIENAVANLPHGELVEFGEWFEEHRAQVWDEQIDEDSRAGKFDSLIAQAKAEHDAGRTRPL